MNALFKIFFTQIKAFEKEANRIVRVNRVRISS
jgi:hypothetical protein